MKLRVLVLPLFLLLPSALGAIGSTPKGLGSEATSGTMGGTNGRVVFTFPDVSNLQFLFPLDSAYSPPNSGSTYADISATAKTAVQDGTPTVTATHSNFTADPPVTRARINQATSDFSCSEGCNGNPKIVNSPTHSWTFAYTAYFVSGSTNIQLATRTRNGSGDFGGYYFYVTDVGSKFFRASTVYSNISNPSWNVDNSFDMTSLNPVFDGTTPHSVVVTQTGVPSGPGTLTATMRVYVDGVSLGAWNRDGASDGTFPPDAWFNGTATDILAICGFKVASLDASYNCRMGDVSFWKTDFSAANAASHAAMVRSGVRFKTALGL